MSLRAPRPSLRIVLLSVVATVSLASAGGPAWAAKDKDGKETKDASEDSAAAQARLHYQKAASLYELGRYQEAIPEYEAAFQLKNDPAFLYNLAQCHRLAGNLEQALHFYRRYLVKDAKETKPALRADSESRIAQLEKLIAQKNSVKTTPPNEQTSPGSTEPPPPGGTTPPPPPPATGTTPPATGTTPPPGPDVTTAPPPPAYPPPPAVGTMAPLTPPAAPVDPRVQRYKRLGYVGMGVGGALVLIGLVEGGRAVGASNEVKDAATNGQPFDPEVEKRGKNHEKAEAVLLVTGVLVGGAGTALFLYGRHLEREVTFTPMASSTGAGGMLRVTF